MLLCGRAGAGEEDYTDLDGIRVRYLESLGSEIRPGHDLRALLALVRAIRSFRPAIVETHTAKAGMLGRLAALTRRPRPIVIHTYHGHVLRGYFGALKTRVFRAIERVLARVSDRLIAVSPATVDELVALGIAPREKFAVVRLGLDLDPFLALAPAPDGKLRAELGAGDGELLLTFTGRLVPIKRPDLMLRSLALARAAGTPARVAVVGDGLMRPQLERLAGELGCAEAVTFLGYRRDLTRIAAGSDAALLTSDNEGTPVALIEAAAAARPAVSTDVGGVADIVVAGTGLLAPAGDAEALAARIVAIAGDARERREMGERARAHVARTFATARLLDDVEAIYSDLLRAAATRS